MCGVMTLMSIVVMSCVPTFANQSAVKSLYLPVRKVSGIVAGQAVLTRSMRSAVLANCAKKRR